jgi:hypothetical protein
MRFPFRVTDRKALKGCLPFTWKPIRFELNREEPGTGENNKEDVNGQNSPVETFQSVREDNLFKQTVHSGKIPVGPSKYACSINFPYGITGISM